VTADAHVQVFMVAISRTHVIGSWPHGAEGFGSIPQVGRAAICIHEKGPHLQAF